MDFASQADRCMEKSPPMPRDKKKKEIPFTFPLLHTEKAAKMGSHKSCLAPDNSGHVISSCRPPLGVHRTGQK